MAVLYQIVHIHTKHKIIPVYAPFKALRRSNNGGCE